MFAKKRSKSYWPVVAYKWHTVRHFDTLWHPLHADYIKLVEEAEKRVQTAEKKITHQEQHRNAINEVNGWIETMNDELTRWSSLVNLNQSDLNRKLQKITQLYSKSLPTGNSLLQKVALLEKSTDSYPSEMYSSLETDVNLIKQTLGHSLTDCQTSLNKLQRYSEDFTQAKTALLAAAQNFIESIYQISLPSGFRESPDTKIISYEHETIAHEEEKDPEVMTLCRTSLDDLKQHKDLVEQLKAQLNELCRKYNEEDTLKISELVMQNLKRFEILQNELQRLYSKCELRLKNRFQTLIQKTKSQLWTMNSQLDQPVNVESLESLLAENNKLLMQIDSIEKISESISASAGTTSKQADYTRAQVRGLKDLWNSIDQKIIEKIDRQTTDNQSLSEFGEIITELSSLLSSWQEALQQHGGQKATLAIKKTSFEVLKQVLEDSNSVAYKFENRIIAKAAKLSSEHNHTATKLNSQFRQFTLSLNEEITSSERCLKIHEDFAEDVASQELELQKLSDKIEKLEQFGPEIKTSCIRSRFEISKDLVTNMQQTEFKLSTFSGKGENVIATTASNGKHAIKLQVQTLNQSWQNCYRLAQKAHQKFDTLLFDISRFEDSLSEFNKWKQEMETSDICTNFSDIENHKYMINDMDQKMSVISESYEISTVKNEFAEAELAYDLIYQKFYKLNEERLEKEKISTEFKQKNEDFVNELHSLKLEITNRQEVLKLEHFDENRSALLIVQSKIDSLKQQVIVHDPESSLIKQVADASLQAQSLISDFTLAIENSKIYSTRMENFEKGFCELCTIENNLPSVDADDNTDLLKSFSQFAEVSKSTKKLLSNLNDDVSFLHKYSSLQIARRISDKLIKLQNHVQNFNISKKKIMVIVNSISKFNQLLDEAKEELDRFDLDHSLIKLVQAESIAHNIEDLELKTRLQQKASSIRKLFEDVETEVISKQKEAHLTATQKKMQLNLLTDEVNAFLSWFDVANKSAVNISSLPSIDLFEKRSLLKSAISHRNDVNSNEDKLLVILEKLQHVEFEHQPSLEAFKNLKEKCTSSVEILEESILLHEEYDKIKESSELSLLDISTRTTQNNLPHSAYKDIQLELQKVKYSLDEMLEFHNRMRGELIPNEDYDNLVSSYEQQLYFVTTKLNQLEFDESEKNKLRDISQWASEKMSLISQSSKPNSMKSARIILKELKTSFVEAKANREQYPEVKLLKRLTETISDEIVSVEEFIGVSEENETKILQISNWIATQDISKYESLDLHNQHKLTHLELLSEEIANKQSIPIVTGSNIELQNKHKTMNIQLTDLQNLVRSKIVEIEGDIRLQTKRTQMEDSVNDQIIRLKSSVGNLLKNRNSPCLKRIKDAQTFLARLENIEDTLDFADTIKTSSSSDTELLALKDNTNRIRSMLTNFLENMQADWESIKYIDSELNEIGSYFRTTSENFGVEISNSIGHDKIEELIDLLAKAQNELAPFRDHLLKLKEKFEKTSSCLSHTEKAKRESSLKNLVDDAAEIFEMFNEKIAVLQEKQKSIDDFLDIFESINSWCQSMEAYYSKIKVETLSIDVDVVSDMIQKHKLKKSTIETKKSQLSQLKETVISPESITSK